MKQHQIYCGKKCSLDNREGELGDRKGLKFAAGMFTGVCSILTVQIQAGKGALEGGWRRAVVQQASEIALDIGERARSITEPLTLALRRLNERYSRRGKKGI